MVYYGDMVDLIINKPEKRVFFSRGKQYDFLLKTREKIDVSWNLLANKLDISKRTLFDWRREKYSLSLNSLKKICRMAQIDLPSDIEVRKAFWSVHKAAKAGGIAMFRKYGTIGDPVIRQKKWQEWWQKTGKYNPNKYFVVKEIIKPEKDTKLAEFIGIVMGDGGMTNKQLTIFLNAVVDKPYSFFVEKLIRDLFKVKAHIYVYKDEGVRRITVSSTHLIVFLQSLDLKIGNKIKQNLDIPKWIKEKEEFTMACIRGLMDTDGCLFMERHHIKNKIYSYPRLSLVSASSTLRNSVFLALKELGFSPFVRSQRSVQLESYLDIKNYFVKIGTNHPKNKKKFLALLGGVG